MHSKQTKKELSELCKLIGCSGLSNKCPGDVNCGILRKMKKKKIKINWSCSNFVKHRHRFKFTAWLCGRVQMQQAKIRVYHKN